jgi:hypothetical protein
MHFLKKKLFSNLISQQVKDKIVNEILVFSKQLTVKNTAHSKETTKVLI